VPDVGTSVLTTVKFGAVAVTEKHSAGPDAVR
jgi:hypothetical protein